MIPAHLAKFDPTRYRGVIPPASFNAEAKLWAVPEIQAADAVLPTITKWNAYTNIVDDQGKTGTCEARSACCWAEIVSRAFVDPMAYATDLQLDAPKIHRLAWLMATGKPESEYSDQEGLPLGASFAAMIELGILPPETELVQIEESPAALAAALEIAPLQMGSLVHDGWGLDRITALGEIKKPIMFPGMSGHGWVSAMCYPGVENEPMFDVVNSWGAAWACNGIAQISWSLLSWTLLTKPIQPRFDYLNWFKFDSTWRSYIVRL